MDDATAGDETAPTQSRDADMVPLDYVVEHARRHLSLGFARAAARAYVIESEAARRGIVPDETSVQEAADVFRRSRGLESARATTEWLDRHGLSVEDFEARIRGEVIEQMLVDDVTSGRVDAFIEQSPEEAEAVTAWRIRHRDTGVLAEIVAIEADGERDFQSLARQCSEDASTAKLGGYLGTVALGELPAAIHDAVRRAGAGAVVGPVAHRDAWELYLVEDFDAADSPAARQRGARALFERWISRRLVEVRIESVGRIV